MIAPLPMRLLHLLPRVPPAVCGVADYAWNLAATLRDRHGIESTFLSAGTSWVAPSAPTDFPVHRLPRLASAELVSWFTARRDEFDAVLLHLSPYGYDKRAVPWWLASAWRAIARLPQCPKRLVFYHELFASGPPTSSAFWLQPLQKRVLRRLAAVPATRITNRQPYADWLDQCPHSGAPPKPTEVIHIFSNFGEPDRLPSFRDRQPDMVMFCAGNHSGRPLPEMVQKAASVGQRLGMERLHVIGRGLQHAPAGCALPVVTHGLMEADAISQRLRLCRAGFTAYTPTHFGKSTLLAAMAAHGLAVIDQGQTPELPDGLRDGRELLHESSLTKGAPLGLDDLESLGRNLRQWYANHSLNRTAERFAELLAAPILSHAAAPLDHA